MSHLRKLIRLALRVHQTKIRHRPALERMQALYALRQFLTKGPMMMVHVSLELALHGLEPQLDEQARERMRELGYQFPEDLDKPREFLSNGE